MLEKIGSLRSLIGLNSSKSVNRGRGARSRRARKAANIFRVEPLESRTLMSAYMLGAAQSPTSVGLSWNESDSSCTGYLLLRSADGKNFTTLTTLGDVTSYTDNAAVSDTKYDYMLIGTYATSMVSSNIVFVTTPLKAPSGVTTTVKSPTSLQVNWKDNDSTAKGYYIRRSTDDSNWSMIATVTSGTATSYTDSTVNSFGTYYYEVEAFNGTNTSVPSTSGLGNTPLIAPTNVNTTANSATSVSISWTGNDTHEQGYYIYRSVGGKAFAELTQITSPSTTNFTDTTATSNTALSYEVEAYNGNSVSAFSTASKVTTPMIAASSLTATAASTSSITLNWSNTDTTTKGYYILRSTNDTTFTTLATMTTASTLTYTNTGLSSNSTYYYEVQAYSGTVKAPVSNTASASTPLGAPTGLAAFLLTNGVQLNWVKGDANTSGYIVLRSLNGTSYSPLATITSGSILTYTDTAITEGTPYYYEVEATGSVSHSLPTSAVTATVPVTASFTISMRYGDEMVLTATGPSDTVALSQTGSTLDITADGSSYTDSIPAAGVFLYTRGGTDTISVASSVTAALTLETIDGAVDTITSAGTDVTAWIDSTDSYSGTGTQHDVASFANGVSKSQAAAMANPSDIGSTTTVNLSLWGTGPVPNDVNQGEVGDCYFLSSLAAFANENPAKLQQDAVDMGDGTYVVTFYTNGGTNSAAPEYIRINNQFASGGFDGFNFAYPGANNTIWPMVFEKAFCYFRTGANTYASINSGWMGEVYADLNVTSTSISLTTGSSSVYSALATALAANEEITFGTPNSPPNLVGDHAYTLMSVYMSGSTAYFVVRNPWGQAGDALENSQGYATLTYAQLESNFDGICIATD